MNSKTVLVDKESQFWVHNPHEYHQMYVGLYSSSYLNAYTYI